MPEARPRPPRKIAGAPVFNPDEWEEFKFNPKDWEVVEGGPAPRSSGVFADPLGKRFSAGPSPEEASEAANTEAATRHEDRRQAQIAHAAKILGAEYDPTSDFQPGAIGYLNIADVARSTDLINQQRKFRSAFGPEAELKRFPDPEGELRFYGRTSRDEPFRELPRAPMIAAAVVSEPTVGSFLGARGGPIATAAGTGLGVLVQAGIETSRGYPPNEDAGDTMGRAVKEGLIAGSVDVGFRVGTDIMFRRTVSDHAAVRAAAEEGFRPLKVGQVSGGAVAVAYRQAGRLGMANIPAKTDAQMRSMLDAAKRQVAAGGDLTDTMIDDIVEAQQRELDTLLNPSHITRKGTAQALQDGLVMYEKAESARVTGLYNSAIRISDDVTFDLTPAVNAATKAETGVLARLREVTEGAQTTSVTKPPAGELASVIQTLKTLDPAMRKVVTAEGEWTAFEQVKALRTRLFDLKNDLNADGFVRRNARDLYNSLSSVMDNPIAGNPEFTKAWRTASSAHYVKESNLEKTYVGAIISTADKNPEALQSLASRYFEPGHATELATFRSLVDPGTWKQVREGFQADLMGSPDIATAHSKLRTFRARDPEGFKMLLSPGEVRDVEQYLNVRAKVESGPFQAVQRKNLTAGERVQYLLNNGSEQDLADLVKLSGGPGSDATLALKAGVYSRFLTEASVPTTSGQIVLDPKRLLRVAEDVQQSGKLNALFGPDDWKRLLNYQVYAKTLAETSDAGTSIMVAETVQKVAQAPAKLLTGGGMAVLEHTVRPIASLFLVGQILATPVAYSKLGTAQLSWARSAADALAVVNEELKVRNREQ